MANGDAAALAGMEVVSGTADRRLGYDEINKTRDYIATKNAALAAVVAAKLTLTPAEYASDFAYRDAQIEAKADASIVNDRVKKSGDTMSGNLDVPNIGIAGSIFNGGMTSVVSGYVAVYRDGSGRLGISPSTRRAKKNITTWAPNLQALLAVEVVTFHYRAAMFDPDDPARGAPPLEVGLIAEDLAALGLDWLVYLDAAGMPAGVHYERLALALLPIVQDHEARLRTLEAR